MQPTNPLDTDFCGLSGADATEILVEGLQNLANGTAIEACAIKKSSVCSAKTPLNPVTENSLASGSAATQTVTIPAEPYDREICLNEDIRVVFTDGIGPLSVARVSFDSSTQGNFYITDVRKTTPLGLFDDHVYHPQACYTLPAGVADTVTVSVANLTTGVLDAVLFTDGYIEEACAC